MQPKSTKVFFRGLPLHEAQKALILLHDKWSSAEAMLALGRYLNVEDFTLVAPHAGYDAWFFHPFVADFEKNEVMVSLGMEQINLLVKEIAEAGILQENIYFLGMGQGACLLAEFLFHHPAKYGGAFILNGILMEERKELAKKNFFSNMPILLTHSDPDLIPLDRVGETREGFSNMGARVIERLYPNVGHTIFNGELAEVNDVLKTIPL